MNSKTFELSITPVSPCNLSCEFCLHQSDLAKRLPARSEGVKKLLEEQNINYVANSVNECSKEYDMINWNLFGGELLMDGIPQDQIDLYETIIKTLKAKINKPMRVCFLTNGVFKKRERILNLLENTGAKIAFSYDPVGRYATPEQRQLFEDNYEFFRSTGHLVGLSMTLSKPTIDSIIDGDPFFNRVAENNTSVSCCYYLESGTEADTKYQPSQEDLTRFFVWAMRKKYYFLDVIKDFLMSSIPCYMKFAQKHCSCGDSLDGLVNTDGTVAFMPCMKRLSLAVDTTSYLEGYQHNHKDIYSFESTEEMVSEKFGCYYCEYSAACPRTCSASLLNPAMSRKCYLKEAYKEINETDKESFMKWLDENDA